MQDMYDFGLRLKRLREQRGLTQERLGKQINKGASTISSYETNSQMPPLDVLVSIAAVLNTSLDYLAGLDSTETYSVKNLTAPQKALVDAIFAEFTAPTGESGELSPQQMRILQKLIQLFSARG